jgi:hypothetical protein
LLQHGTGQAEALSVALQQVLRALQRGQPQVALSTFSNLAAPAVQGILPSDVATDLIYRAQLIKDALRHLQR